MKNNNQPMRNRILLAVAGTLLIAACSSITPEDGEKSGASTTAGRSGADLWAERCSQCHNLRSPGSLSDSQWYAAMAHMRIRAYLTGDEERKIRTFLQAGN